MYVQNWCGKFQTPPGFPGRCTQVADMIVIALEPIAVQEMEEIILEDDAEKALEFLSKVIKPQIDRGVQKGKGFFEEEAEPFFE
jgi:hypothetical protein